MSAVSVKTNGHARDLLSLDQLPADARRDFDYVDPEDGGYRFVQYRGSWYDVNDTQVIGTDNRVGWGYAVSDESPLARWDSILTDSAFSAVVFRYVPDTQYEQVVVGLALS